MNESIKIGSPVQSKRTGTKASIADIFPNGLILLSNGAILPEETFLQFWQILEIKDEHTAKIPV